MNKLFARSSRFLAGTMMVAMLALNASPLLAHAQADSGTSVEATSTDSGTPAQPEAPAQTVAPVQDTTPAASTTQTTEQPAASTTDDGTSNGTTTTPAFTAAVQTFVSMVQNLAPLVVPTPGVTTNAATNVTASDATLNGTNGAVDADGHSFWVSTADFDTSSPTIPSGVYSTPDFGAIASNTPFSATLSSITTSGVPSNMPAVTPNTTYHFVAWTHAGGTWIPGAKMTFTTGSVVPPTPTPTTVVVNSNNLNGWYFYDDKTDAVLSDTSDHGFVSGPSTPAIGTGSAHLTKTTTDRYGIATTQYAGTALSDITALSYSTYRASGSSAQVPSLGFDVDVDGGTHYEGRLTYEPYFTNTVNTGAWQTWNTLTDTGNWWFSHANDGSTGQVVTTCTQSTPCTWAQVKAQFPNAKMRSVGQLILRTNGADGQAFDGNVDNLTIGTASSSKTFDFEPVPPVVVPSCGTSELSLDQYNLGSVNGQHGWSSTGPYDQEIVTNTYGYPAFGCKSLRISNAVTSGAFGDQTFTYSNPDETGETEAVSNGMSGGTRHNRFATHFSIASTMLAEQPGLSISVSPDRGDGARMSYLRFEDHADGIHVFFDDVEGMVPNGVDGCTASTCANFVETEIAGGSAATPALSRTTSHIMKYSIDFNDGPSNDVVRVFIDQTLVHTGTTWEDYYRFDPEQAGSGNKVPTTDSLIFRAGGTAVPANSGKGFLFDNINFFSLPIPTYTVKIDKFVDGAMATPASASSTAFAMLSSWNAPNLGAPANGSYNLDTVHPYSTNAYEAITSPMNQRSSYTTNEVVDGTTVGSSCTLGAGGPAYKLDGYTTGATLADAEAATPTLTAPNFTDLEANQYVIVWNSTCAHDIEAPSVPVQLQPIDGQARNTNNFDFDWSDSTDNGPGPVTYEFQSSMDGTEVGGVLQNGVWSSGTLTTSMIHSSGAPDGIWYWQVRAKDAAGNYSAWSPVHHMAIDSQAPAVPTITTPADDSHYTTANFTHVDWTDESDSGTPVYYTYQAASDAAFTNVVYTSGTLTDHSIPTTGTPEGTYYLRVKSFDFAGNESGWSTPVKVTVENGVPTATLVFETPGPSATGFKVVYSQDVNQSEAENPANYFLANWPGAGGSGPLTGNATVSYDSATKTATVHFTNPAWYVSAEQKWGVTGVHNLSGTDIAPDPTSAYSSAMVAPGAPGAPTTTSPTASTTQEWMWTAATDPGGANASGVATYQYLVIDNSTGSTTIPATKIGNVTTVTTNLPIGSYTFHLRAIDNAGNKGAEATSTLEVTAVATSTPDTTVTPTGTTGGGSGISSRGFSGSSSGGFTSTSGTTGGQVLGASTFNFTHNLKIGSKLSPDVTELQKVLIAGGYLKIDAPTGYFGSLTRAAVAAWQAANGISPAAGYFGPISRAKLNAG
jgi:hypothetical protein